MSPRIFAQRVVAALAVVFSVLLLAAPAANCQAQEATTSEQTDEAGQRVKIHVDPKTGDIEVEKLAPAADAAAEEAPKKKGDLDFADEALSFFRKLQLDVLWIDNTWVQWAFLGAVIFMGLVAGKIAAAILKRIGDRWKNHGWVARGMVFSDAASPANLVLLTVGVAVGLAQIRMSEPVRVFCGSIIGLLILVAIFWYGYNLVGVLEVLMKRYISRTSSALDNQVLPLIRKSLRLLLMIVAALTILEVIFGADVGAALAGLGIAGLAISLAAQDSLKNLFGSILILFDRPFQVGDRIVFQGYDGTVEEIGFRSTKVRTLVGHLVTVPNSAISNEAVENIARRPFLQRKLNVTITYDTPPAKIEEAIQIIRDILESEEFREPIHPKLGDSEFPPRVFFNDFNADSLNIFVIYWYAPTDWWAYNEHAQRFNLELFRRYDEAGIEFAFPTRTLFLAGDPKRELAIKMLGADLRDNDRPAGN